MNRTLLALWAIIAMSIVAILSLAVVWNTEREKSSRLGLSELLVRQLEPYNRDIARIFDEYELKLRRSMEAFDPASRTDIARIESDPLVGQLVIVEDKGAKGAVLHPRLEQIPIADRSLISDAIFWLRDSNLTQRDRAANSLGQQVATQQIATQQVATQQVATQQVATQHAVPQQAVPQQAAEQSTQPLTWEGNAPLPNARALGNPSQWTTWYHQRGLILGYWTACGRNSISMAIVPRGRWLADVVAALPDKSDDRQDALIQLTDFEGNVIAQWGNLDIISNGQDKDAELAVVPPLEGWRLRLLLSDLAREQALGIGSQNRWASLAGALGCSMALVSLGVLLTLNLNRQLRLAQQQVSFVNQVSHELRTPLTNIRMYADLAMNGMQEHSDRDLTNEIQRIGVIQQESGRLGRLIDNVLCFARLGKSPRELRIQPIDDVEQLITDVIEPFLPQMVEQGIRLERVASVKNSIGLDRAIFEQILVNLVGNALKYAASGKFLRIETSQSGGQLHLLVIDKGPGIPKRMQNRIFQPFVRLGNRLEDPTGTGIGLSIARSLARQHGGDITLEPSTSGCQFHLRLQSSAP